MVNPPLPASPLCTSFNLNSIVLALSYLSSIPASVASILPAGGVGLPEQYSVYHHAQAYPTYVVYLHPV